MKTSRRDFLAASGALVAASLPLASQVADAGRASRFPSPNWPQTTDLQSAGTSQERLAAYDAWLREHAGISWASVVIMDGYLVYEGRGARSNVHQKNDCGSITEAALFHGAGGGSLPTQAQEPR